MSNLQGFSLYLCVLFIHLFPAGFRENLCAAARQAVLIQIAFRVGYRSLLANKHSWTEPSHIPASTQIKTGQSWGGVERAPPAEEEQATSTLVGWMSEPATCPHVAAKAGTLLWPVLYATCWSSLCSGESQQKREKKEENPTGQLLTLCWQDDVRQNGFKICSPLF